MTDTPTPGYSTTDVSLAPAEAVLELLEMMCKGPRDANACLIVALILMNERHCAPPSTREQLAKDTAHSIMTARNIMEGTTH